MSDGATASFDDLISVYKAAYREHGRSQDAVLWPRGRQAIRYRALLNHVDLAKAETIVDFGCGLGFGAKFMRKSGFAGTYIGIDVVPDFIDACREMHPDEQFILSKGSYLEVPPADHIVASGAFGIALHPVYGIASTLALQTVAGLFERAEQTLAVDFMRSRVDFRQPGSFHQDPAEFLGWCQEFLTQRISLDLQWLPYEFTATLWRAGVQSPQGWV
jgi:SAM-dependent methyltransferase